jgi:hypothetical protein
VAEKGAGEASATDQRSELVYYRLPNSRPTRYLPATLRLADGGLSLTEPGGTPILSCALSDVSKVVIDHSTLHLHLPQGRIAVTLYPHAGSQAGGSAGRVLYVGFFVNGWSNIRDGRLRGWKRALRAGGVTVRDRNTVFVPGMSVIAGVFAIFVLVAVVIQIADWL